MSDIFDPSNELLCDESKDVIFDDDHQFDIHGQSESQPLIPQSSFDDENQSFVSLLEREKEYLPNDNYLPRLRCGLLDLVARNEAFDWIFKAHSYYSFGPLSLCLAVNYLDRFFSIRELPKDKAWTVQLLAVACLSIAAKIEETSVPHSIDLQVGDPKYVFEAKTIQRMELLVLDTLQWKMNAVTPCSFLQSSLKNLSDPHSLTDSFLYSTSKVVNRSMQLISCSIRGIDYLEFRPSEIAAAVAISVSAEIQAVDISKAVSCFAHLEKERVVKCVEMIKGMSQCMRSGSLGGGGGSSIPHSPIGVLDAGCFSYKSDELTTTIIGSYSNSSQITTTSPEHKRMKLGHPTST